MWNPRNLYIFSPHLQIFNHILSRLTWHILEVLVKRRAGKGWRCEETHLDWWGDHCNSRFGRRVASHPFLSLPSHSILEPTKKIHNIFFPLFIGDKQPFYRWPSGFHIQNSSSWEVCVKVQHHGVGSLMKTDLVTIEFIAGQMMKLHKGAPDFRVTLRKWCGVVFCEQLLCHSSTHVTWCCLKLAKYRFWCWIQKAQVTGANTLPVFFMSDFAKNLTSLRAVFLVAHRCTWVSLDVRT